MSQGSSRRVRFGAFTLDLCTDELWDGSTRLKVPDQSIQILEALLERPGELATREDLRDRLWPSGTYVDYEHGLNAAVRRLREALGDSADAPRYVETLPRRGYRFIADVEEEPASDGASTALAPAPPGESVATVRDPRKHVPLRPRRLAVVAALMLAGVALQPHPSRTRASRG